MEDDGTFASQINGGEFMDNGGIENHLKKRRLDGANTPINLILPPLVSDPTRYNQFQLLADLDVKNNDVNVGRIVTPKDTTAGSKRAPGSVGNSFCPPIFLYNVNIKHLVEQLEAKTPKIVFKIKNVNKHKSKLYLSDVAVHSEMMSILREKKINAFTFTPKELKQMSLVLRGLYHTTEAEDVKLVLDDFVPGVVSKVSKFTTSFSTKNNINTGLFLVTLVPGKKLGDVSHIKFLLSQSIIWEKPKKKELEIQCRRCQHWGHIARNCTSEFKCVKCDQKHLPGECSRNESANFEVRCVNCKESGHPANWRGCPAYKKYVVNKRDRMKKAREEKSIATNNVNTFINSSTTTPAISYASHFHPKLRSQNGNSSIVDAFLKLSSLFMEPEEPTLEDELNNFLREYKNMSKAEAKTEFLRLLSKVKANHGP